MDRSLFHDSNCVPKIIFHERYSAPEIIFSVPQFNRTILVFSGRLGVDRVFWAPIHPCIETLKQNASFKNQPVFGQI